MISSGLKKLAQSYGMQINGVAYGDMRGYAATLSEGSGWRRLDITGRFDDVQKQNELQSALNTRNLQKEFAVQQLSVSGRGISVTFLAGLGALKKLSAFLDFFLPLLPQSGLTGSGICPECGNELYGNGKWKSIDGVAYHLHEACAERLRRSTAEVEQESRREGSYGTGLIGAIIGGLIGAVVWALVLNLGYITSLVGLLIGFLAERGYHFLRGKEGKGKLVILILVSLVCVIIGTLGADVIEIVKLIKDGTLMLSYGQIPELMWLMFTEEAEYMRAVLANLGLGVLFAGLGLYGMLSRTYRAARGVRFRDLP